MSAANAAGVGARNALAGIVVDVASTHVAFAAAAALLAAAAAALLLVRQRSLSDRTVASLAE